MSKSEVRSILNANINTADFYTIATTIHKNHKRSNLKIRGTFLEDIYKDNSRYIKIKKSTQVGVSEWLIVRAICRARTGRNVFYVFPTYELKNQFVKERFDKSIMFTKYYADLSTSSEGKMFESLAMKQMGGGTIAFVGSNSAVSFLSYPADDVIIDERNKCNNENIGMAPDRQGASVDKTNVTVSNPDYAGFGIDIDYEESDQKKWNVKCDHCGTYIVPDFFEHVVREVDKKVFVIRDKKYDNLTGRDIQTICHKCEKPFNRYMKGNWVPDVKHDHSGYHISKLFSGTVTIREMVDRFNKGLSDDTEMQHFYNNDLGLGYTAQGVMVSQEMIKNCTKDYNIPDTVNTIHVAGIDVGNDFNIIIGDMNNKVNFIGTVKNPEDVILLLRKYKVGMFIIDALPEKRTSIKIVKTMKRGFMCYYVQTKNSLTYDLKTRSISTDRTMALDAVKEIIVKEEITFPANAQTIKGFYEQMTSSTRIFNESKNNYDWIHNKPDHYFHATAYMLLAKKLLVAVK